MAFSYPIKNKSLQQVKLPIASIAIVWRTCAIKKVHDKVAPNFSILTGKIMTQSNGYKQVEAAQQAWANGLIAIGNAYKAQDKIRMILKEKYMTGSDGLSGNDDFGQMSAWYLFSSLGFYPVAPGSVDYALGSPAVKEATLNLDNGNTFKVEAKNQSVIQAFC